ncbi:MAG: amidohydrolase [Lysobacterales bacterium CG02_land_8_20_14_3_00_62_12]|nr:MAG: amidohydrolase [Xanthomonadales bacterium CG02_land_8_20_14_3_00_62_12]PJA41351.1 MAG: amidohydrolase [Xanthomonadales bacterium CG_4_9_14_3_um_filter_62_6]
MRRILGLGLMLSITVIGQAAEVPAEVAAAATRQVSAQVLGWRRDIHQHPELGNRETRTAALVAAQLRALGLEVQTGIAKTGVTGLLKGALPGPRIAIRADMDALPVTEDNALPFASKVRTDFNGSTVGVMHACGHDAHTAMTLGVATALAAMRAELHGEVLFIFQPAEEGPPAGEPGGAELMLDEGLFDRFKPAAIFGMHVFYTLHAGQIGVREGPMLAGSDRFQITVQGRQTHGAQPWRGVDPIVTAALIVNQAQTIVSRQLNISELPAVLSFGMIHGGLRWNIIPDQVALEGTIRSFDPAMRQQVFDHLQAIAEHVAAAQGASVVTKIPLPEAVNPVTVNDPALTRRMRGSLERAVGADQVITITPNMVAEDFARFADQVPGMYFFVGSVPPTQALASAAANHSPLFMLDEAALDVGTRAMLQVALDALSGQALATPR